MTGSGTGSGGSPDTFPPLECGASMHGADVEGGVAEGQRVESGGGDNAGFCWVFPVEVGDGVWSEDIRVFNPLVMQSVIPFKVDKVVE